MPEILPSSPPAPKPYKEAADTRYRRRPLPLFRCCCRGRGFCAA